MNLPSQMLPKRVHLFSHRFPSPVSYRLPVLHRAHWDLHSIVIESLNMAIGLHFSAFVAAIPAFSCISSFFLHVHSAPCLHSAPTGGRFVILASQLGTKRSSEGIHGHDKSTIRSSEGTHGHDPLQKCWSSPRLPTIHCRSAGIPPSFTRSTADVLEFPRLHLLQKPESGVQGGREPSPKVSGLGGGAQKGPRWATAHKGSW